MAKRERKQVKKVVQPEGTYNLFWTDELFEDYRAIQKNWSINSTATTIVPRPHNTWQPYYFISKIGTGCGIRVVNELNTKIKVTSATTGKQVESLYSVEGNSRDGQGREVMRTLFQGKRINFQFQALVSSLYSYKVSEMKRVMMEQFDHYTHPHYCNISTSPHFTSGSINITGALNIVKYSKIGLDWAMGVTMTKEKRQGAKYMVGPYFAAQLVDLVKANYRVATNSNIIGESRERTQGIKPLYCLMVKKEYSRLISAHYMLNKPVDVTWLELWVDKSINAEDSTDPLREQFIRAIRNPMIKAGIPVREFDSLRDELYHSKGVPEFKTMNGEKGWIELRTQEFLDSEKKRLGIVPKDKEEQARKEELADIDKLFDLLDI